MILDNASLRVRLLVLILLPLIIISIVLGYWRYNEARQTAETLFDRSLLATALAIARDVAISQGDALSPGTLGMMQDAAGGKIFYHVTGPDGIYVTGYAYPPRIDNIEAKTDAVPHFYQAQYHGEPVRVVQLLDRVSLDNLSGPTSITVWQRFDERGAFATAIANRTSAVMLILILTVALVVWLGVERGLSPLRGLHREISQRSADDLRPLERPVPVEVRGAVTTLNHLLAQVRQAISAHQVFISNAAHQLRNPIAGVLSLAESAKNARNKSDRDARLTELIQATRHAARVSEQLLSAERLRGHGPLEEAERFDLRELVRDVMREQAPDIMRRGIEIELDNANHALMVRGRPFLLREAMQNLLDNALTHGGDALSYINISTQLVQGSAVIEVKDNGIGIPAEAREAVFERFTQHGTAPGSGLGLAIVNEIAQLHDGIAVVETVDRGACVRISLPIAESQA